MRPKAGSTTTRSFNFGTRRPSRRYWVSYDDEHSVDVKARHVNHYGLMEPLSGGSRLIRGILKRIMLIGFKPSNKKNM